jgi:hypothetical protein
MKLRSLACAAVLAAVLVPSAAFADQTKYFECMVGWSVPDSASVVVGVATTQSQQLVQDSAALCSFLISTGLFKPADKYYDYDSQFDRACVIRYSASADAVVWEGTDARSRDTAAQVCSALQP